MISSGAMAMNGHAEDAAAMGHQNPNRGISNPVSMATSDSQASLPTEGASSSWGESWYGQSSPVSPSESFMTSDGSTVPVLDFFHTTKPRLKTCIVYKNSKHI